MSQFRKKPIVVEAFQMTQVNRRNMDAWPTWLYRAWNSQNGAIGSLQEDPADPTGQLQLVTAEGTLTVLWGDWLIQDADRELSICKDAVFTSTHDAIPSPAAMQSCMDEAVITELNVQHTLLKRRLRALAERFAVRDKSYDILDHTQYIDIKKEHVAEAVQVFNDALDMWSVPSTPQ